MIYKIPIFSVISFLLSNLLFSQDLAQRINKSVRFGFSAGVESKFKSPYEAYLDPSSLTLEFDKISSSSFVISTSLIYMPNYYFRTVTPVQSESGSQNFKYGDWEYKSSRIGAVVSFNIAEISPDTGFNSRLDGGIGIAYAPGSVEKDSTTGKYNPHPFYISLNLDFSTIRQIKEGLKAKYEGLQIPINGQPLNALDSSNNSLFTNKTFVGLSIKVIYLLN